MRSMRTNGEPQHCDQTNSWILPSKGCFLELIENPYNPTTSLYIMEINLLQRSLLNSYHPFKKWCVQPLLCDQLTYTLRPQTDYTQKAVSWNRLKTHIIRPQAFTLWRLIFYSHILWTPIIIFKIIRSTCLMRSITASTIRAHINSINVNQFLYHNAQVIIEPYPRNFPSIIRPHTQTHTTSVQYDQTRELNLLIALVFSF